MPADTVQLVITDSDGVLTDGMVGITEKGDEFSRFSVQDGLGVKMLQAVGIPVAIVSSRRSEALKHRADRLGIDLCFIGVHPKLPYLDEAMQSAGVDPANVAYLGDDLLDLPCLRKVGFPVAVDNAREEVKEVASYVTTARGGHG
ncbi:MAG: HAD-IIIA family hydrolase, partial [Planctomycetota bacterium]